MATTKIALSGSPDGKGIKVAATATPGTTIHSAHASDIDEIHIYAVNTSKFDERLTLEWGGTTDPDDTIEVNVPSEDGLHLIVEGLVLTNSLIVRAFSDAANVIILHGFSNRITP